jgi:hypothetical protein
MRTCLLAATVWLILNHGAPEAMSVAMASGEFRQGWKRTGT